MLGSANPQLGSASPQPGDAVSGVSGEFFRYASIFMRAPTDDDRLYFFQQRNLNVIMFFVFFQ